MYRWHWFKKFVLEQGDDDATRSAVTRLMALARLEKRDTA